jgi:hypothetical protein
MILAIQPNSKKKIFVSFMSNSKHKNAHSTAAVAPQKERIGTTKSFLTGLGIAVLSETVMENK